MSLSATSLINVFLADDHSLVREGLRLLIEAQQDLQVVGEAGDGESAWRGVRDMRPDIVVMDVSMPVLGGAPATEHIRASCPEVKIIAVSAYQDAAHIRQMLTAGASGYVLKKAASQELVGAIRTVVGGEIYLDPTIAAQIAAGVFDPTGDEEMPNNLSAREMEVLLEVAWGHTNMEIAAKLHLSVKTIEGHKAKIGEKLGLSSRAQIVRYALRRGWLRDE